MSAGIIEASIVFVSLFAALTPVFLLLLIFFIPFCPDSECTGYWKRFPFLLLQLLAIPAGFFVVTMMLLLVEMRGYFVDHFDEYKCSPWFMPFVSFIRPDVSTTANFESCTSEITSAVYSALSSPLLDLSDTLGGGMNLLNDNMGTVQQSHNNLHSNMLTTFGKMNNQMGAFQAAVQYISTKVGAIFSKMMALIFDLYYAFLSVTDMINVALLMPSAIVLAIVFTGLMLVAAYYLFLGLSAIFFAIGGYILGFSFLGFAISAIILAVIMLGLGSVLSILHDIAKHENANY